MQRSNLGVRRRSEVPVPPADSLERLWLQRADNLVGHLGQVRKRLRRRDRYGEHDVCRIELADRQRRSPGRRAGRQAVVDEDHHTVPHR